MKNKKNKNTRPGVALLVVLFIVMTITILSLGFLSRSDVELACGENMILKTQMDYLAESGLEHAKGLILSPQDVDSEYWTGAVGQQLSTSNDDYYDVNVVKLGECNYQITSDAYREKNGERIGRSSLQGELRLDPCIAYWVAVGTPISQRITINGDVYCNGDLTNNGTIGGDVFTAGGITNTGSITGQMYPNNTKPVDVNWPGLEISDFSSQYYYDGSGPYLVQEVADGNYSGVSWPPPNPGNPAGIYYCNGDLRLEEDVIINGTLVVDRKLIISGGGNRITAIKNFPAIIIGDHLEIKASEGAGVTVEGLIQSRNGVHIRDGVENALIEIVGGLFTQSRGIRIDNPNFGYMTITAAPVIASIQTWPEPDTAKRWTPAAGAFFRSIERK